MQKTSNNLLKFKNEKVYRAYLCIKNKIDKLYSSSALELQ